MIADPAWLFLHRLALEWQEHDVEGLAKRMTGDQMRSWMAYFEIEPWGGHRIGLEFSALRMMVAGILNKSAGSLRIEQFMLFNPKPPLTVDQLWSKVESSLDAIGD